MKEINLTITVTSKSQFKPTLEALNRLTYVKNITPNPKKNTIGCFLIANKYRSILPHDLEKEGITEILIRQKGLAKKKIFAFFEKREK